MSEQFDKFVAEIIASSNKLEVFARDFLKLYWNTDDCWLKKDVPHHVNALLSSNSKDYGDDIIYRIGKNYSLVQKFILLSVNNQY